MVFTFGCVFSLNNSLEIVYLAKQKPLHMDNNLKKLVFQDLPLFASSCWTLEGPAMLWLVYSSLSVSQSVRQSVGPCRSIGWSVCPRRLYYSIGYLWDTFRIVLGQFKDSFGILLRSFWDSFRICLGNFWNNFGYFQDTFWILLGYIYYTFMSNLIYSQVIYWIL